MPIYPEQLGKHLDPKAGLAAVYLVTGNEPLLVQECCDDIIAAARAAGHDEWERVDVASGFDWESLRELAGAQSLFASRRVLDLRLASANQLDRAASTALRDYLQAPFDDLIVLIRVEQLDGRKRQSAWFKAIDKQGVVVQIWPLGPSQLGRWLQARCRKAGLQLQPDALNYLAGRVEGNLLAAVQEIEKLRLLELPQPLTAAAVRDAVVDASHYDSFDLCDAALAGQGAKVCHILNVLRAEGLAPLAVLGAVQFQLRQLQGTVEARLPPAKARLMDSARGRLTPAHYDALLQLCWLVDQQSKGACAGDAWQTLELILLQIAGVRNLPPLLEYARYLQPAWRQST